MILGALPPIPTKADLVYEALRERILDGAYAPGERLNMDAIAKELGVSKIPVREAIGRLEAQRLVETRQHAGPIVAALHPAEIRAVYLVRERVDALVAELAAQNATAVDFGELERLQTQMEDALDTGDATQLPALNSAFHATLARASGFRTLVELTEQLLLAVRHHRSVEPLSVEDWASAVVEHRAIIDAVRRGDAAEAASAAKDHAISQYALESSDGDSFPLTRA